MKPLWGMIGYSSIVLCSVIGYRRLEFQDQGKSVKLQGLLQPPMDLTAISATKVYNATKGNDIWEFVLLDYIPEPPLA